MSSQVSRYTYLKQYSNLTKSADSKEPDNLLKYIQNKDVKTSTKANNLNAIISLMKDGIIEDKGIDKLREQRDEYQKEIKEQLKGDNLGKYRDRVDRIHMEHLDSMLSKLFIHHKDDLESAEDWLLFSLMWPHPLRNDLQEISLCTNYRNRGKSNCIYLPKNINRTAELRINEHKTTSRGGDPIVRELSPDQAAIAKHLFADGRQFLFQGRDGKSLSSSAFTHRLANLTKKWLGIPLTSTALRKIFLTGKYRDIKNMIHKQQQIDAKKMGQSVHVQNSNYIDNGK